MCVWLCCLLSCLWQSTWYIRLGIQQWITYGYKCIGKYSINCTSSSTQASSTPVQLFAISNLYISAWAPCLSVEVVQVLGYPTFLSQIQIDFFLDLIYVVCLFLPWVCIGLLPELNKWVRRLFPYRQAHNSVVPNRTATIDTKL
ncbi:unnamed protein product [Rotaria socialis]|uniref:Uncharacterized protein n=1 Tax=Rotaria socialis TaxID=392032 RepID=A0A818JMN6_9BILA|nr:unnamed protein product [Rotaria socialis]